MHFELVSGSFRLFLLIFFVAMASVFGCAVDSRGPTTTQPANVADEIPPAASTLQNLDFREVIRNAKEKVFPAVVFIRVLRDDYQSGQKSTTSVAGSGVLISLDGEVVTNWHVVDKAREVRCLLYDSRTFTARVVGSDKDTDLALLQINLDKNASPLPFAQLGDSTQLKEGAFVMAMGAPYGLSRSVSMGIIACTHRYLEGNSEYSLWLQTDATICPGNSGGPLVDTAGKIIGINSRGIPGEMGFAIPSQTVQRIVPQLRQNGKVNWSWTGLQIQSLKNFDQDTYFDGDTGVIVAETDPDSPARQAGIQPRDRLLSVNGVPFNGVWPEHLPELRCRLGMLPKYQPAEFVLRRGDKTLRVSLTAREKGKVEGEELDCQRWDMTVKTINQFDNPDLYFQRKTGVFVFGVKYPGNASSAGLETNDILLKIDSQDVATLDDVRRIHKQLIDNLAQKHRVVIHVLRNGLMEQIILDFSRDYKKE